MSDELMRLSDLLRKAANVDEENKRLKRELARSENQLREYQLSEPIRKLQKEISEQRDEINRLRIGHKELKQKAGDQKHRADCLQQALDRIKETKN